MAVMPVVEPSAAISNETSGCCALYSSATWERVSPNGIGPFDHKLLGVSKETALQSSEIANSVFS